MKQATIYLSYLERLQFLLITGLVLAACSGQKALSPDANVGGKAEAVVEVSSSELNCISGYVVSGGDTSPAELRDAPRLFKYDIGLKSGELAAVAYRAVPPLGPGRRQFELAFHNGGVQKGDYLEACGLPDSRGKVLRVAEEGHYIRTHPSTTVLAVRHAERSSNDPNSDILDPEGLDRAQRLATTAMQHDVAAIYVSKYCRTAQTALPSARSLGIGLFVQPSSDPNSGLDGCDPAVDVDLELLPDQFSSANGLADGLTARHRGQTVLVVGHSDTVPEVVVALRARALCPETFPLASSGKCSIPDDEFGSVLTVYYSGESEFGSVQLASY